MAEVVVELVVMKLVVVPVCPVKSWRVVEARMRGPAVNVEEAVERKPFKNARVVEVACSLVASLVNGQENVIEPLPQPLQLVTVRLPMLATFARRLVVEAKLETYRLVVVALVVVEFWKTNGNGVSLVCVLPEVIRWLTVPRPTATNEPLP